MKLNEINARGNLLSIANNMSFMARFSFLVVLEVLETLHYLMTTY